MDADGLGGVLVIHIHRDRDRQRPRQGVNVVHKAKRGLRRRSDVGAVSRLKPDYRNEKNLKIEQFLSAWVVVSRSFRPSFLKTYTV